MGRLQLSILGAFAAFGAIGATLALVGVGVPFLPAALAMSVAVGLVQWLAQRLIRRPRAVFAPASSADEAQLHQQLEEYRTHSAVLRHDLRGVLSPALMMSDRLLKHPDPAVQRAGTAVVRSIERATALLATSKDVMQPVLPGAVTPSAVAPDDPAPPAQ